MPHEPKKETGRRRALDHFRSKLGPALFRVSYDPDFKSERRRGRGSK